MRRLHSTTRGITGRFSLSCPHFCRVAAGALPDLLTVSLSGEAEVFSPVFITFSGQTVSGFLRAHHMGVGRIRETWRERRRASRTGRQDGGQRLSRDRTKLPGAILNSACAGPERTSPRDGTSNHESRPVRQMKPEWSGPRSGRFPAQCRGCRGTGETSPCPFTRKGQKNYLRIHRERNSPLNRNMRRLHSTTGEITGRFSLPCPHSCQVAAGALPDLT